VRRVAELMPDVTFVVTGTLFPRPVRERNVIGTGLVDDPLPYLQAADLSVCPVEFGGGTKIKVLEALSVGLPTVVFAEAMRGLSVRDGEQVWVAEKHESSLAAAIRRLLRDQGLALRLGLSGRRFVVEHHDWRRLAATLENALLRLQ
jgi:glycosyltransferase involved in cell wall biosynthesis